jgi:hypothetical protein
MGLVQTIYDATWSTIRSSSSFAMNYGYQGLRLDSVRNSEGSATDWGRRGSRVVETAAGGRMGRCSSEDHT